MNEQHIELDVSKRLVVKQIVRIGQDDKGGTTIVASIYDNGTSVYLPQYTTWFCMRIPNTDSYVRGACTTDGNVATYVVDETKVAQKVGFSDDCYFEICRGSTLIASTNRFSIHVLLGATHNAVPAQSWDNMVDALITRGDEALDEYEEYERARRSAETTRQSNEATRQSKESARQSAETARRAAETSRADAESARRANESTRVSNEAARVAAESERASASATATSDAVEAAARANDAADAAEEVLASGIPLMTASRRGGAKLGSGFATSGEALVVKAGATWTELFGA